MDAFAIEARMTWLKAGYIGIQNMRNRVRSVVVELMAEGVVARGRSEEEEVPPKTPPASLASIVGQVEKASPRPSLPQEFPQSLEFASEPLTPMFFDQQADEFLLQAGTDDPSVLAETRELLDEEPFGNLPEELLVAWADAELDREGLADERSQSQNE